MKEYQKQSLSYVQGGFSESMKAPWGREPVGQATPDRRGYDQRPSTFDYVKTNFKARNPEFDEGASLGDWTSWKFTTEV